MTDQPIGKQLLFWIVTHLLAVAGAVLVVVLIFWYIGAKKDAQHQAEIKAAVENERAIAKASGAIEGEKVKTIIVRVPALTKFTEAEKKAGARVVEQSTTSAELAHSITGKTGPETAGVCTGVWTDAPHNRFRFPLPSGPLEEHRLFEWNGTIIGGADGVTRFGKVAFTERDPVTKEAIPSDGVKIDYSFQYIDEKAAAGVGVFHPRAVAALNHHVDPGAGVEALNYKDRVNLSLLGYYDKTPGRPLLKRIYDAEQLGFRVPKTNASVGPFYSIVRKEIGVGATLELTR